MKLSVYSPLWNVVRNHFDYRGALDNWALIADEISLSVNTSDDGTYDAVSSYAHDRGYPVSIIQTSIDFAADPFAYGKVLNAALQNATGDLMFECDLDERISASRARLEFLHGRLLDNPQLDAFYIPTIDLYGGYDRYLPPSDGRVCAGKWYLTRRGISRGPVPWGIKPDGRPDYNKTSTDEPLREDGGLARAHNLFAGTNLDHLKTYIEAGWPAVWHLGYCDYNERLCRSLWWREYWEMATGGDTNRHPTSVEDIATKQTVEHGLPLWDRFIKSDKSSV